MKLTAICRALPVLAILVAPATMAKTVEDFQTWANITATGNFGFIKPDFKSFKYWIEGQGRFGENTTTFSQGMARVGLGYQLNSNFSLWGGYAFIPTSQPFAKHEFDENRIWQQLIWSNKFDFATVTSRSRFEQRFVETGNDVGWRFRQMFKVSVPFGFAPSFSFVVSDEYFANINKTNYGADDGFDQNRAFGGLGYNFDKNVKAEIGYMNQYIYKAVGPDRMSNILSVNLFLNY